MRCPKSRQRDPNANSEKPKTQLAITQHIFKHLSRFLTTTVYRIRLRIDKMKSEKRDD